MTNHELTTTKQDPYPKTEDPKTSIEEDSKLFDELADLCNLPEFLNVPTTTTTTPSKSNSNFNTAYDLNLEDLPTFDLNDLDLSNIDLSDLSIDFSIDAPHNDDSLKSTIISPVYEPTPLPDEEEFNHECGYCGEPAGWRHNTKHFIRLRSGSRYACFACLCQRWRGECLPHQSPGISFTFNTKTRHRRLPRRRILTQRHNKSESKLEQQQST